MGAGQAMFLALLTQTLHDQECHLFSGTVWSLQFFASFAVSGSA